MIKSRCNTVLVASLSLLSLTLLPACAHSGHHRSQPLKPAFSERAGTVTEEDLFVRLPRVLARHGYLIEYQELRPAQYLFETQWKRPSGILELSPEVGTSRMRLRLTAQPQGLNYSLRMEAEYQALGADRKWYSIRPEREIREWCNDILRDVRSELSVRLRRF